MGNDQSAGCWDQQEKRGAARDFRLHQRTGIDGVIHAEIRQCQRLEDAQGFGEFIDLFRLPDREIGSLQAARVVFSLRLAARIGGGGVRFERRIGETVEARAQFAADLFEQCGFHHGRRSIIRSGCEIKFPEPQPFLASSPCGCQTCAVFTVYAYQNCDSCRKALKWLATHGVPHQVKAIRETPPAPAELKAALQILGGDIRKLFNTSGADYRELGMKDRLPAISEDDAIRLLSENGNLVKRPFLTGNGVALCGFKEDDWRKALL